MSELSRSLFEGMREAFVAESMTAQRYAYFAQIAEIEGHLEVSKLLGELAESVACAAHGHLDFLQYVADPATDQPIGETHLNLASSITGGLQEADELYPRLAAIAHSEGFADVASWLETLCALKKTHVTKLNQALAAMEERMGQVG
ncbi:rubrerythrin family protein [Nonomuraea sp. SYSU D8015]|uniref:rubrerythrin family protein n=1 Tax=Nonomuraea sp. SYSU D8015 TaxID=2593644 RepID=UPI001CB70666|nr:rubrerythrin family protein [Nonomuraea sp. SYSU D8015]